MVADVCDSVLRRANEMIAEVAGKGHLSEEEAKRVRKYCRKGLRGIQLFTDEED